MLLYFKEIKLYKKKYCENKWNILKKKMVYYHGNSSGTENRLSHAKKNQIEI